MKSMTDKPIETRARAAAQQERFWRRVFIATNTFAVMLIAYTLINFFIRAWL